MQHAVGFLSIQWCPVDDKLSRRFGKESMDMCLHRMILNLIDELFDDRTTLMTGNTTLPVWLCCCRSYWGCWLRCALSWQQDSLRIAHPPGDCSKLSGVMSCTVRKKWMRLSCKDSCFADCTAGVTTNALFRVYGAHTLTSMSCFVSIEHSKRSVQEVIVTSCRLPCVAFQLHCCC